MRPGLPSHTKTLTKSLGRNFVAILLKCFLDDITSIYGGARAQGQTCALGPWPRDARLGGAAARH